MCLHFKHYIFVLISIVFLTNLIVEASLAYATSVNTLGEKEPFVIKPRNALPIYKNNDTITIDLNTNYGTRIVTIPYNKLLVKLDLKFNDPNNPQRITDVNMQPNPKLNVLYDSLMPAPSNRTVFIYPTFTQAAYSQNGFYDYYAKKCDSKCLTVKIPTMFSGGAYASAGGSTMLYFLNYEFVTDIDVDKDPSILNKYDKVILMHNEYVTQNEFDAITKHKNVVYLYPNALYAKVKSNYKTNAITLQKGHAYPNEKISNGFGWKYDNSKYEYDLQCNGWKFTSVSNGKMLNCNPDYRVFFDKDLLMEIKK